MQPNYPQYPPQGGPQYPPQPQYPGQNGPQYPAYPPPSAPPQQYPSQQYPPYPPQPQYPQQAPQQAPAPVRHENQAPPTPEEYAAALENRSSGDSGPKWPRIYLLPYPGPKIPGRSPQIDYRFGGVLAEDGLIRQQTEFVNGSSQKKFYEDGNKAWETLLIFQTAENILTYDNQGQPIPDDGRRGYSVKGWQEILLSRAVKEAGDTWPPKAGGQVYATCTGYVNPATGKKGNQWIMEYIPGRAPVAPQPVYTQQVQTPGTATTPLPVQVEVGVAPTSGMSALERLMAEQRQAVLGTPEHHGNPEEAPF